MEILAEKTEWRCYNKNVLGTPKEVEHLAERYIISHATVPGLLTEETISVTPMFVFEFEYDAQRVKGLVFLNGCVIKIETPELTHYMLFVQDGVAKAWKYPSKFIRTADLLTIVKF